jgi:hypothetical protein
MIHESALGARRWQAVISPRFARALESLPRTPTAADFIGPHLPDMPEAAEADNADMGDAAVFPQSVSAVVAGAENGAGHDKGLAEADQNDPHQHAVSPSSAASAH